MHSPADIPDEALLELLGHRLARHRLNRGLTQAELAHEAGIAKRTLERMEAGSSTQLTNALRVLRVLGLLPGLDELVPEPPESPLERLERERRRPKRARRSSGAPSSEDAVSESGWTWADDDDATPERDSKSDSKPGSSSS